MNSLQRPHEVRLRGLPAPAPPILWRAAPVPRVRGDAGVRAAPPRPRPHL